MSNYDETPFDGMSEAVAMGVVMEPPEGFLADAVARGLAIVEAEEALAACPESDDDEPVTLRPAPRRRHDSGVFRTAWPPDAEQ